MNPENNIINKDNLNNQPKNPEIATAYATGITINPLSHASEYHSFAQPVSINTDAINNPSNSISLAIQPEVASNQSTAQNLYPEPNTIVPSYTSNNIGMTDMALIAKKKSSVKPLIIIISILLLAAAAFALYWFVLRPDDLKIMTDASLTSSTQSEPVRDDPVETITATDLASAQANSTSFLYPNAWQAGQATATSVRYASTMGNEDGFYSALVISYTAPPAGSNLESASDASISQLRSKMVEEYSSKQTISSIFQKTGMNCSSDPTSTVSPDTKLDGNTIGMLYQDTSCALNSDTAVINMHLVIGRDGAYRAAYIATTASSLSRNQAAFDAILNSIKSI